MVRGFALIAIVVAAIWFGFFDTAWRDRRPVERILWLGHSFTYNHDMPDMVARIADSAGSEVRYDIVVQAFGGASLEKHWNNARSRESLAEGNWDRVVIHPESRLGPLEAGDDYFRHGAMLFEAAGNARRVIVSTWIGSDPRPEYLSNLETNLRGLANLTGAQLIDVAQVWEDVRAQPLPFPLYRSDGHHPSLQGSYLAALVVYAELAQADVGNVRYAPWRMSREDAALLRDRVQRSLRRRRMAGFANSPQRTSAPPG